MKRPIGLFDSGFGGLSVMKELTRVLPQENMIYLGDSAHLPFGNKSQETIIRYSLECARFLMTKNIKLLIIACHTACSYALKLIQEQLPIPVIGVIQPGIEQASLFKKVAVLATQSTIDSGVYQSKIRPPTLIYPKACPLFVPLIEEGFQNHISAIVIAKAYLGSFKGHIDAALLACTHYPLLKQTLRKVLKKDVVLIEPAIPCAQNVLQYLMEKNLLNQQTKNPQYQFFTSDDPKKFRTLGEFFLGSPIETVEKNKNL